MFTSIDEMVDLTNIGTLFAFILVCMGIIVLRVREPNRPRPFRVPGGIIIPVLGIISCLYLIYYLPPTSWLRFAAWLNLGFVIYVGYGSVHSRLTGRHRAEDTVEHNTGTAHAGAWLGVIGVGLLFFMRGMDIWMDVAKIPGAGEGLATQVFSAKYWLDLSWFLVVPLALNAYLLCPMVFRRAITAKRLSTNPEHMKSNTASILIASLIACGSTIYLLLVAIRSSGSG
jgi:amino acid transporter